MTIMDQSYICQSPNLEPEPKWETVQPTPTYNEATPMATSVKERYADLGSNSDEDGSSEEDPRLLSEEEYLPTEKEELPIPPAGGEIKVFADIDDRDIIQYLSGDAAKARALVDAMAKDVQGAWGLLEFAYCCIGVGF